MSVMRISIVGKRAEGRRSHQILVASSMQPSFTRRSTMRRYSAALEKVCGSPARGSSTVTERAVGFEPRVPPLPERRGDGERQKVRQEVDELPVEIDPQILVGHADMDVHAADQEPLGHCAEVRLQLRVALLGGGDLRAPVGEGMRGGRHQAHAVPLRFRGDGAAVERESGCAPRRSCRRPRCRPRSGSGGIPASRARREFLGTPA